MGSARAAVRGLRLSPSVRPARAGPPRHRRRRRGPGPRARSAARSRSPAPSATRAPHRAVRPAPAHRGAHIRTAPRPGSGADAARAYARRESPPAPAGRRADGRRRTARVPCPHRRRRSPSPCWCRRMRRRAETLSQPAVTRHGSLSRAMSAGACCSSARLTAAVVAGTVRIGISVGVCARTDSRQLSRCSSSSRAAITTQTLPLVAVCPIGR